MPEMTEAYDWRGRTILDQEGTTLGKIDQVYLGQDSHEPRWALVETGLFGGRSVFVPCRPRGRPASTSR
jgi:uncharacterized protein YrrD